MLPPIFKRIRFSLEHLSLLRFDISWLRVWKGDRFEQISSTAFNSNIWLIINALNNLWTKYGMYIVGSMEAEKKLFHPHIWFWGKSKWSKNSIWKKHQQYMKNKNRSYRTHIKIGNTLDLLYIISFSPSTHIFPFKHTHSHERTPNREIKHWNCN